MSFDDAEITLDYTHDKLIKQNWNTNWINKMPSRSHATVCSH